MAKKNGGGREGVTEKKEKNRTLQSFDLTPSKSTKVVCIHHSLYL